MKIGLASKWGTDNKSCGIVHTRTLLDLLKINDVQLTAPGSGNGTRSEPYENLNMPNWRWLAGQEVADDPIFYSAGNRLLVRWGKKMGYLRNYISDMTDYQGLLEAPKAKAVLDVFTKADEKSGIDTTFAAYHKKALRVADMTDEQAAQRCRGLLMDSKTDCSGCPEIASSFCSLFVAEANRAPQTFVASLMLLDLVESHTTYGVEGGKTYTWKSMLMHSTSEGEAINVPGRGQDKTLNLAKHPMAGIGTAKLGKDMNNWGPRADNAVRDRMVSLISIWVGHYLQKTHPDRTYYRLRTGSKDDVQSQVKTIDLSDKKCDQDLLVQCIAAITHRCNTPGVLIGGTSLGYLNFKGEIV